MSRLTLIPTPLCDTKDLDPHSKEVLLAHLNNEKALILVEEHKIARRRWLHWGLPREGIERFICFNEHTQEKLAMELVSKIKNGHQAVLMSDCGLPAFCDPGQKLVDLCHRHQIQVSATSFPNSIGLSIALCGYECQEFIFRGFLPANKAQRKRAIDEYLKVPQVQVMMDTPYHLHHVLEDLSSSTRELFIGVSLNQGGEVTARGSAKQLKQLLKDVKKAPFVIVLSAL